MDDGWFVAVMKVILRQGCAALIVQALGSFLSSGVRRFPGVPEVGEENAWIASIIGVSYRSQLDHRRAIFSLTAFAFVPFVYQWFIGVDFSD